MRCWRFYWLACLGHWLACTDYIIGHTLELFPLVPIDKNSYILRYCIQLAVYNHVSASERQNYEDKAAPKGLYHEPDISLDHIQPITDEIAPVCPFIVALL